MHGLNSKEEMENSEDNKVNSPQDAERTYQNGSAKTHENAENQFEKVYDEEKSEQEPAAQQERIESVPDGKTNKDAKPEKKAEPAPRVNPNDNRTGRGISRETTDENKTYSFERIQNTLNSMNSRAQYLVEWENTVHSGTALGAILTFLIFTAYYSLFNTFCFLAIVLIGADWAYVFLTKQFKTLFNQDAVNPHDKFIQHPPHISRELVREYTDLWVDILNFLLAEGTKIVFVQDPYRSIKYVVLFYLTWTVACWFSFRFLLGTAAVLAFAVPKLYKQNKELVDKYLDDGYAVVRQNVDKGTEYVTPYLGKMKNLAANGIGQGAKIKPPQPITLYYATVCPFAQRTRIALKEVNFAHEHVEIDLQNKPAWYKDINASEKVPVIKYGDTILSESLVLVDFIAELAQETPNFLPKDPVQRAQARIFTEFFGNKFMSVYWPLIKNQDDEKIPELTEKLLAVINDYLVKQSPSGPYFLGDAFSTADLNSAPFAARLNIALEVGIIRGNIKIPTGEGYDRYHQWVKAITSRKSVKETLPMATELVTAYNRYRNKSDQ
ncbi:2199_t:CDS:10 [Ambispora leptoticha]|uniref:Reticulon-like protein n=1 Tax=Ambispora leptoticha TaxID=144679 RepID=A0A9N9FD84_9GLOM|nr:2199_t:CDS:10 [Ambispora leptoticha]